MLIHSMLWVRMREQPLHWIKQWYYTILSCVGEEPGKHYKVVGIRRSDTGSPNNHPTSTYMPIFCLPKPPTKGVANVTSLSVAYYMFRVGLFSASSSFLLSNSTSPLFGPILCIMWNECVFITGYVTHHIVHSVNGVAVINLIRCLNRGRLNCFSLISIKSRAEIRSRPCCWWNVKPKEPHWVCGNPSKHQYIVHLARLRMSIHTTYEEGEMVPFTHPVSVGAFENAFHRLVVLWTKKN